MATVWAMARMNYLMMNLTQSAGYSRYASSRGSMASSAAYSGYSGLDTGLAREYTATSKAFDAEFSSTMDALKDSSDKLKKVDFGAAGASPVKETAGEEAPERSEAMEAAVAAVGQFAKDYNAAIDFFRQNAHGSGRMTNLAGRFADTAYRARTYAKVGLNVDTAGKLKVDEETLTAAIKEDPGQVESLLGKGGLASKADTYIAAARAQQSRLFSSILSADNRSFGGYSSNGGFSGFSSYAQRGNMLNFYI
ncbi:MAG: flagellar filament capping protein FliD [Schwartzia sp.]|nr:flagellar filament capping protein FliD [Schwartzia sp. (in: firmicutes)]